MPVTFTTVGTSIVASIVDGNFADLERFMREELLNADINTGQITRLIVHRYENGRLVSSNSQALPILDENQGVLQNNSADYDCNFRHTRSAGEDAFVQAAQTMELLGKPGPSMYWQFQEDGTNPAGVTYTDPKRYPEDYCYSHWLTVPNCSLRVYVPHSCIARVEASSYFLGCIAAIAHYITDGPAAGGDPATIAANNKTAWDSQYMSTGNQIAMQWALVVDTNPVLTTDFPNTNPNILNAAGTQASHVSWKIFDTKKIHAPLWQREAIDGSVILKGGAWYNFSLKFKGAGTMGYRAGGTNPVVDGIYEMAVAGLANYYTPPAPGTPFQEMPHVPPHEVLWISSALHVELIYGYSAFHTDSSTIIPAI